MNDHPADSSKSRESRTARPSSRKHRSALIRAAIRLFRRNGYAQTGLNEILRLSGAPKGSLYHYFPGGKEELGAAAVAAASATVEQTLLDLEESTSSPMEFLGAYLRLLAGWLQASSYRDGCPVATTLLEMAPESAAITTAGREGLASWVEVMARSLGQPGQTEEQRQATARTVVAAVEGALLLARTEQSSRALNDVEVTLRPLLES